MYRASSACPRYWPRWNMTSLAAPSCWGPANSSRVPIARWQAGLAAASQRLRPTEARDRDRTVAHPGRPVTIGVPLPTYSVVILDRITKTWRLLR